ncbi:hypothetical protein [Alteriqipengyuania lutimaris]|uniref:hypothetical protein n=1 Tax=Alteriqipengyuania lutimaris TaxID=1538146 RepID=UPI0011C042A8|nr:hypothetical protein [Alteriqipengyuania lutimaris]MBB3034190.1 hypothetical protein [Alteriqipengyuania lutimaris]
MAEHAPEETQTGADRLIASAVFPVLVAAWFAALLGAGFLFLPPVLFDALFGELAIPGVQTRLAVAVGAAGVGLLLGLFIANRVRSDQPVDVAPAKPRRSKRDARPPLDVRAALGLPPEDDDEDERAPAPEPTPQPTAADEIEYELSDEHLDTGEDPVVSLKAPIDDPHFASAWSDAEATAFPVEPEASDVQFDIEPAEQTRDPFALLGGDEEFVANRTLEHRSDEPDMPAWHARTSRYNPFADHLLPEDGPEEEEPEDIQPAVLRDSPQARCANHVERSSFEKTPDEGEHKQRCARFVPPAPPPPPPAWPEPRAQEPALSDLGVAELVERLARALQHENGRQDRDRPRRRTSPEMSPARSGQHRHDSALSQMPPPARDVDQALRSALDRLARLDDVA